MIKFEKTSSKDLIIRDDESNLSVNIQLASSSITNKYEIVIEFIEKMSSLLGKSFDKWLLTFLKQCEDEEKRGAVITQNVERIKKYCKKYLKLSNINYSKFVDETKAKKNSIFFDEKEIEKIILLSSYLKLYSLLFNSENLKPTSTVHQQIYNELAEEILNTEIVRKIYDVIKTKTFRYNLTDRYMWKYIESVHGKDIGIHVVEIFNFIINNILILCEETKNPIIYFVCVIDESVKWFLRSVYKNSIIYEDTISTEDVQGINVDNLRTYCFNDSLGRLKIVAFDKIYKILEKNKPVKLEQNYKEDEYIVQFHERLEEVKYVSPVCDIFVYPILSKVIGIPYNHLRTLSPEHSIVISVYLQDIFRNVFLTDYSELIGLLNLFPTKEPALSTTYKIRHNELFINAADHYKNFFGFNTKVLLFNFLSQYVGRLSRLEFCNILDGRRTSNLSLAKVESDVIKFFVNYFSNNLKTQLDQISELINKDF